MTGISKHLGRSRGQEPWRVFCALELTSGVRIRLMQHIARLRQAMKNAEATWSREQNLHLTLKFLGDVPPSQIRKLSEAVAAAVAGFSPFQISIEQTGVFPTHGKPRVLWIGVNDKTGMLAKLYNRLEEACAREGFAKEERPFHPHLTLARLRRPQGAPRLAEEHERLSFEPSVVEIAELLVMRSELNRDGSRHTVISRHALGTHTDESS